MGSVVPELSSGERFWRVRSSSSVVSLRRSGKPPFLVELGCPQIGVHWRAILRVTQFLMSSWLRLVDPDVVGKAGVSRQIGLSSILRLGWVVLRFIGIQQKVFLRGAQFLASSQLWFQRWSEKPAFLVELGCSQIGIQWRAVLRCAQLRASSWNGHGSRGSRKSWHFSSGLVVLRLGPTRNRF